MRQFTFDGTFADWKAQARSALQSGISPDEILWRESGDLQSSLNLFETAAPLPVGRITVPKKFLSLAEKAALHSDSTRWSLLYRVLWRLARENPDLLDNPLDSDVVALTHLEKDVSKDAYRMIAFLRFREVSVPDGSWFIAWYEPEHDTLACNADFFIDRFHNMRWSILTPRRCMHWDTQELTFSEGVSKSAAPTGDRVEPLWISYYSNIFNPARLKVRAMQAQLLKRNWKNLPEAAVIEPLLRESSRRTAGMLARSESKTVRDSEWAVAAPPAAGSLEELRASASACRACPLWRSATCTVFGEGPANSRIMVVGEQPGDQEDLSGHVFVGPAGQLLTRSFEAAGLRRENLYMTNAVKHFKWEPRGKRRIHQTPNSRDIAACRPWLEAELRLLNPAVILCLGSTAAQAVTGTHVKILEARGQLVPSAFGPPAFTTVHPSYLLRLPDAETAAREQEAFVRDLRTFAKLAQTLAA